MIAALRALVIVVGVAGFALGVAGLGVVASDGAAAATGRIEFGVELVQAMFFSVLGVVIAVRAWDDVQARRLAIGFLWTSYFFGAAAFGNSAWSFAAESAYDLLGPVGMAALVFFATGWEATPVLLARWLRGVAVVVATVYAAVAFAQFAPVFPAGGRVSDTLVTIESSSWALLAAFLIAGLLASFARAGGLERRRIGWILATMTIGLGPWLVFEPLAALRLARFPGWIGYSTLVLPFGFGYATLRHRVVDLGFALNRAAVFAATTALLVGLFGALQWGADQLLFRATGAQNFAVQMTIAVVVLYAVRILRTQTDALVARVFFAARRRRIDAIAALARAVDAVETLAALAPFVVEELRSAAAIEASLYVDDGAGYVRAAGVVDLAGAVAFPLTVRGRSRGALVCRLPSEGEEFAPDEHEVLERLAARVCVVRDDLLAEQLRRENAALRADNAALAGRVAASRGDASATAPLAAE